EPATNDLPVREDKVASRVRFDVERAKNSARNQRVDGTRIDKTTDFFSAAAVRRVTDPDVDECQTHLDTLSPARNCPHRPRCPFCAICGERLMIVLPILPIPPVFLALAPGPLPAPQRGCRVGGPTPARTDADASTFDGAQVDPEALEGSAAALLGRHLHPNAAAALAPPPPHGRRRPIPPYTACVMADTTIPENALNAFLE